MSLLNFDASRVAPSTGELEPIPAAWYDVVMDQSELKPTKDAATTGNAFLECRFNVMSGQFAGRKLFARLNLRNGNPVAAEIAQKELSAICHAVGVLQVQDSQQLHGIPMKVKVKVREATAQYSASNEITTFKHISHVPDGPQTAAMPAGAMPPGVVMPPPVAAPAGPWAAQPQPVYQQPQAPAAPPVYAQPQAQPQQPWQQPAAMPAQAAQPQQPAQPWQQPTTAAAPAGAGAPPAWNGTQGMPPGAPAMPPAAPPVAAPQQPWTNPDGSPATPPWQQPR